MRSSKSSPCGQAHESDQNPKAACYGGNADAEKSVRTSKIARKTGVAGVESVSDGFHEASSPSLQRRPSILPLR